MSSDFITKRPHKKSRGGCKTCKTKKVKCDEAQPKCSFCEKRNLTCIYIPRTTRQNSPPSYSVHTPSLGSDKSSPDHPYTSESPPDTAIIRALIPNVQTSSGTLTPLALRAMHFWSVFTSYTIVPGSASQVVFQVTIPQLAFENEYLLHVMLGISSLHMHSLLPDPENNLEDTYMHRAQAFAGYRDALMRLDVSKTENWEAALITSIMLTVLCAKDYAVDDNDLVVLHWLTLYSGLSSVINLRSFTDVTKSSVAPIFRRTINELQVEPCVPLALSKMLDDVGPMDPDYPDLECYRRVLSMLGILYASLRQDGVNLAFRTRVISWPSLLKRAFIDLAKQKGPRALILLGHYLVFVKTMTVVWWVEGVADKDIRRIVNMLPPRWYQLFDIPRQALKLTDADDLMNLLLGSISSSDSAVRTSVDAYMEETTCFEVEDEIMNDDPGFTV